METKPQIKVPEAIKAAATRAYHRQAAVQPQPPRPVEEMLDTVLAAALEVLREELLSRPALRHFLPGDGQWLERDVFEVEQRMRAAWDSVLGGSE